MAGPVIVSGEGWKYDRGVKPDKDELTGRETVAEETINDDDGCGCASNVGVEATTEGKALLEVEGENDGANTEGPHDGYADAILKGVTVEFGSGGSDAGDGGDGEGSNRDGGIDRDSDGVTNAVNGTTEKVEAGAEVGDGNWGEGGDKAKD